MDYHKDYYQSHKEKFVEYYKKRKTNVSLCELCERSYLNIEMHYLSNKHKKKCKNKNILNYSKYLL